MVYADKNVKGVNDRLEKWGAAREGYKKTQNVRNTILV